MANVITITIHPFYININVIEHANYTQSQKLLQTIECIVNVILVAKGSHFGSCHSKYNYTLGSRIKLTINVITVLAIVITAVKQSSKLWKKTRGELKLSGRSPGELYLSVPQKSIKSSSSFN